MPSPSSLPAPLNTSDLRDDLEDWLEALADIHGRYGAGGVDQILQGLRAWTEQQGIPLPRDQLNTPYLNSIPLARQPDYPGNLQLEKRIENILRWNAMAMVLQAQDSGLGLGGHIATYGSAATLMEVGFNHFFRGDGDSCGGDLLIPQPHCAPGIYARAFLEGRIDATQMGNYRRELQPGGGLPSYPHPFSLPDFWQVPNASMGLSTPTAIYQARFIKYLQNRGLKPERGGKVWCFIGDGECDEPEVLGTIAVAAREQLDNLIMVVNCNLQRLDGPVRGNGKIIQELEASFKGAGWHVIKVIWGGGWDRLLEQDRHVILRRRMEECLDGDYQRYTVMPGNRQREHWVDGNPELERMMNALTDEEVREIKRGGQDERKIYAAYRQAQASQGKPVVILIKTVKGDGMGPGAAGSNTVHQKKNLGPEERLACARAFGIPLSDEQVRAAQFYKPAEDSLELQYLRQRRRQLGGYLPHRNNQCPPLSAPSLETFAAILKGSADKPQSTTQVTVRLLATLMKLPELGRYVVPIVPDEARTFGLDGLFNIAGIYSPGGQRYTPVDAESLLAYREARDGQILQEGICEAGAIASFMAAGTAYAVHGLPMIPFYFFYSIFGFQRVGDMVWSCGDMLCRGFLIGGTAGRTTLNGEGLQHQDGHSHLLASTYPTLVSYDPAFGFEIAIIVRDGIRRMYQEQENVFYYLTVYNENHAMPPLPQHLDPAALEQGIVHGGYLFSAAAPEKDNAPVVNLLGSGAIMQQVLKAAAQLQAWGIAVNVFSITSFTELRREAEKCDRWNRLHPLQESRIPHVSRLFATMPGVFVAATDYMAAYADSISRWVPGSYTALGTDGYGLSESRAALRDYFEVSAAHIAQAALVSLHGEGALPAARLQALLTHLGLDADKPDPMQRLPR
ncbi:MAG: hypothetical protein RLZZ385_605 [Pseudomonadota bacterium]|jgi:pyruvate dehydrogenase E1 component